MPEKIRPPSPKHIRDEAEGDLQDIARAPDPAGREVPEGAIDASAKGGGAPLSLGFSPLQAAEFRAAHEQPNALGKPAQPNAAERLLLDYNQALAAVRQAYQGTRMVPAELQKKFDAARERMIAAGLLPGGEP